MSAGVRVCRRMHRCCWQFRNCATNQTSAAFPNMIRTCSRACCWVTLRLAWLNVFPLLLCCLNLRRFLLGLRYQLNICLVLYLRLLRGQSLLLMVDVEILFDPLQVLGEVSRYALVTSAFWSVALRHAPKVIQCVVLRHRIKSLALVLAKVEGVTECAARPPSIGWCWLSARSTPHSGCLPFSCVVVARRQVR